MQSLKGVYSRGEDRWVVRGLTRGQMGLETDTRERKPEIFLPGPRAGGAEAGGPAP